MASFSRGQKHCKHSYISSSSSSLDRDRSDNDMSNFRDPGPADPVVPSILRLPSSVQSLLRSTTQLPSLSSLVTQLVHNALDASATKVHLTIDVTVSSVVCVDNGVGFEASLLRSDCAMDRYVSTKHSSPRLRPYYGVKGEALASMAAIGMLRIDTFLYGVAERERWTVIKKGDNVLFCGPSTHLPPSNDRGTIVEIRDIYADLPLRRPFRTRSHTAKELQDCRKSVLDVALREPHVAFLVDVLQSSNTAVPRASPLLTCTFDSTIVQRFSQLRYPVTPSQCGTIHTTFSLHGLHSSRNAGLAVTAQGFFLLEPSSFKHEQRLYLQGHLTPIESDLTEAWSIIAGDSRILRAGQVDYTKTSPVPLLHWHGKGDHDRTPHQHIADTIARGFSTRDTINLAGSNGAKRHERSSARWLGDAVFLIDITLRKSDDCQNDASPIHVDERAILDQICQEIRACQESKGIIPRDVRKRPRTDAGHKNTASLRRTQTSPSTRKRAKTAMGTMALPSVFPSIKIFQGNSPGQQGKSAGQTASHPRENSDLLPYFDPWTKKQYLFDERTGNTFNAHAHSSGPSLRENCRRRDKQPLLPSCQVPVEGALTAGQDTLTAQIPQWLRETVGSWVNPAFPHRSRPHDCPIRSIKISDATDASQSDIGETRRARGMPLLQSQLKITFFRHNEQQQPTCASCNCCGGKGADEASSMITGPCSALEGLRLAEAQIVSQVDSKYIICLCPISGKEHVEQHALIAIDQHAADERVRFEQILSDYVAARRQYNHHKSSSDKEARHPASRQLKAPVSISLPLSEADRLLAEDSGVRNVMEWWGLQITDAAGLEGDGSTESTVVVTHVPEPVADRLRVEKNTLASVVLGFLDKLPEGTAVSDESVQGDWMTALRHLPPRLMDLFKSKACRGAIMFNDRLDIEQCHRLVVHQLADTTFPLRCAHGRVSMSILCKISSSCLHDGGTRSHGGCERPLRRRGVDWDKIKNL